MVRFLMIQYLYFVLKREIVGGSHFSRRSIFDRIGHHVDDGGAP